MILAAQKVEEGRKVSGSDPMMSLVLAGIKGEEHCPHTPASSHCLTFARRKVTRKEDMISYTSGILCCFNTAFQAEHISGNWFKTGKYCLLIMWKFVFRAKGVAQCQIPSDSLPATTINKPKNENTLKCTFAFQILSGQSVSLCPLVLLTIWYGMSLYDCG